MSRHRTALYEAGCLGRIDNDTAGTLWLPQRAATR